MANDFRFNTCQKAFFSILLVTESANRGRSTLNHEVGVVGGHDPRRIGRMTFDQMRRQSHNAEILAMMRRRLCDPVKRGAHVGMIGLSSQAQPIRKIVGPDHQQVDPLHRRDLGCRLKPGCAFDHGRDDDIATSIFAELHGRQERIVERG